MNNQTASKEKKRGIVTNFASFTPAMLQSMKYDTGLSMSDSQLNQLRNYYRHTLRRDPYLDELYFVDRLIELKNTTDAPITELATDSDTLAQTYADLMAKRNAIKGTSTPPTVAEVQQIASEYLSMVGKSAYWGNSAMFAHDIFAHARLLLNNCKNILSTSYAASGRFSCASVPAAGDLIIIVLPPRSTDITNAEQSLQALFESGLAKCGEVIDTKGIIASALQFADGIYIDTAALPVQQPCELSDLCDACHGDILTIVSNNISSEFLARANGIGLEAFVIGSLSSDKKLTINNVRTGTISFSTQFINGLTSNQKIAARLCESYSIGPHTAKEAHLAIDAQNSTVMATRRVNTPTSPFFESLYATIQAISDCVAQGADYGQVCLSSNIQFPPYRDYSNQVLESMLGIYRAQMEFCVTDRDSTSGASITADTLSVNVCALAPLSATKPKDSTTGTLYLLQPPIDDSGLPHFDQLRRMWNYVTQLHAQGKIISARAVAPSGVKDTLSSLIGDEQVFIPYEHADSVMSSSIPCGVLLISSDTVDSDALGTIAQARFDEVLE